MRRIIWTPGHPSIGPSVAAVGVFDGVHVGHQDLLRDTTALAESEGVASAVLTFEPDPHTVVAPHSHPPRILDADQRSAHIAVLGVDLLVEVPFSEQMARMDSSDFIDTVLEPVLSPVALVVGRDFRFGAAAAGDVAELAEHGRRHGYRVVPRELTAVDGSTVTATRIRNLIARGDVSRVTALLGRPHRLSGAVVHGSEMGRTLGAPTANLAPQDGIVIPAEGVYAARASLPDGLVLPAAVSVGAPPTFEPRGEGPFVEAHLIGVDRDLYDTELTLDFVVRLRDLVAFPDPDALSTAIAQDIGRVLELLGE